MSTIPENVEQTRRRLLAGGVALAVTLATGLRGGAGAAPLPGVTVYKAPS